MGILGNIIYSTMSSKEKTEKYQKKIRDAEWEWLRKEIPANSHFLDVGCGAGYAMQRAAEDLHCTTNGIDPNPGAHGVGRYVKEMVQAGNIKQGFAEELPWESQTFDVVFSSHVLEHVEDEQKSLREMKRVLKDDGVAIIGMPTATMALIGLISTLLFRTHIKVYEFFRNVHSKERFKYLNHIFSIGSHSSPRVGANSILYDLKHYRVKNWEKIVTHEFQIIKVVEPCLYPYPDFPQWFPLHYSKIGSSSVFFVCKKR